MNITGSEHRSIIYRYVQVGSIFRWLSGSNDDPIYKSINGHLYLKTGHYVDTKNDPSYIGKKAILLDHELIIKGEL